MRIFLLVITGLLLNLSCVGQEPMFSPYSNKITIDYISPDQNRFLSTFKIFQNGTPNVSRSFVSSSSVSKKSCGYEKQIRDNDGNVFALNPKKTSCRYIASFETQELKEIVRNDFQVPTSNILEYTIQFRLLLKSESYYKLTFNSQDEDLYRWISIKQSAKGTDVRHGYGEEDWGSISEDRTGQLYQFPPGLNTFVVYSDGDRVWLKNLTKGLIIDTGFTSHALSLGEKSKFNLHIAAKEQSKIVDFYFKSPQLKRQLEKIDNSEDNKQLYFDIQNKVGFLSIANDYAGANSLHQVPLLQSVKLNKLYEDRNFTNLGSIHNFKKKKDLEEELLKKADKIKKKGINILFVHYGGHGAYLSGSVDREGIPKHALLPVKFDSLYSKYKNNPGELYDYVPTTEWFIEELQKILSKSGQDNEFKFLHLTIDACRNYQSKNGNRSAINHYRYNEIVSYNKPSMVFTTVRHSTPKGSTADNDGRNSYTKQLIEHLTKNINPQEFVYNTIFDVYTLYNHKKYNTKSFGPKGKALNGGDIVKLNDFTLNQPFNEYVTNSGLNNDD